jgi:type IV secretion system protein VirB5
MQRLKGILAAGTLALAVPGAHPQVGGGIPVIDYAAVLQLVTQVTHVLTMIDNQLTQIEQGRTSFLSMTGTRGLGSLARDPALNNYVPLDAPAQLDGVAVNGYGGLTGPARALRDADMVWNCDGMAEPLRTQCQASLAQPYQNKALLRQVIATASARIGQISQLITAINSTDDQAAKLELGARINGEQALLQHEGTRAQMLWVDMQNEQRREEARSKERTAEMMTRPLDVRSFLPGAAP